MVTPIHHTLMCGATRSGKSEAILARLVPLARANDCAIVLIDPPGTLAEKFLLHLDALGLTHRVLYDRLRDTDRTPGYPWLSPSANPEPFQRAAENDERVRAFAAILLRRRGIQDPAATPLIEETVLAALRLYLHQSTPVPVPWLADVFTLGSASRAHLLAHCTEPDLVRKFHEYGTLSLTARRAETAPAERILRAVLESPSFRVRSGDATVDLGRFLDERGILILDGGSEGNLSRDAASVMMGALILQVLDHCRSGTKSRVVLVLDEATNAGLIGVHESQALAEAAKWSLAITVLAQDPFSFPSEEIRRNVLQNAGRHEWFRQGSPEAARLAAEDIATPLLNPLLVHHTEDRIRAVDAGFERVETVSRTEQTDPFGYTTGRSTNWRTVLWPRRKEVRDRQDRYTALTDQILLMQKELMLLSPGYRFVRAVTVNPSPEYLSPLADPWTALSDRTSQRGILALGSFRQARLARLIATMKERSVFRAPFPPVQPHHASSQSAAHTLNDRRTPRNH